MDVLKAQKFKLSHTLNRVVSLINMYKTKDILYKLNIPNEDIEALIKKINEIDQRLTK